MRHVSKEPSQQCSVTSWQLSQKFLGFFQLFAFVLYACSVGGEINMHKAIGQNKLQTEINFNNNHITILNLVLPQQCLIEQFLNNCRK